MSLPSAFSSIAQTSRTAPLCTHFTAVPRCRGRHAIQAVLATPLETQNQKRSTREALQSAVTITAVKTPYLENGRIDLASYDRLVERQCLAGVEGVIVGGTTGEGQVGVPITLVWFPLQHIEEG